MAPRWSADFYIILEVDSTATASDITKSYRKLAIKWHPDKNHAANATEQFQKLGEAYAVLKDELLRRNYDRMYPSIRKTGATSAKFDSTSASGPSTACPSPDELRNQAEENKAINRREAAIKRRNYQRMTCDDAQHKLNRLNADIDRLQTENAKDVPKPSSNVWTWLGFAPSESSEEKQEREFARLQRSSAINIKSNQKMTAQLEVVRQQRILADIESEIATEDRKIAELKRKRAAAEAARQQKESERHQAEQRAREEQRKREAAEREAREDAARKAREQQWQREAAEAEARQREWRASHAERQRQAKENEAARAREQQRCRDEAERLARQKEQATRNRPKTRERKANQDSSKTEHKRASPHQPCRHEGWWDRVEGRHNCEHCSTVQFRFILTCPRCDVTACANCRPVIQGRKK